MNLGLIHFNKVFPSVQLKFQTRFKILIRLEFKRVHNNFEKLLQLITIFDKIEKIRFLDTLRPFGFSLFDNFGHEGMKIIKNTINLVVTK